MRHPWSRRLGALLLAAFATLPVLSDVAESDVPGWALITYARKPTGNLSATVDWDPTVGLRLLVVSRERNGRALLEFSTDRFRAAYYADGSRRPFALPCLRPKPVSVLYQADAKARLVLKFRDAEWLVYVQDALVGRVPAPFRPPALVYAPAEPVPLLVGDARFQPVSEVRFRSDFMIEEGAPNQLYPWQVQAGEWRIHTALDDAMTRPESNVERIKKVPLTADKSPNFYCLKGQGTDAVITTGYEFYDHYSYAAAIRVSDGTAGLVFYHRDASNYYVFDFTIRPGIPEDGELSLWRVRDGQRRVLARFRTKLFDEQWYRPRIEVRPDRILCYLDEMQVADVPETMPCGGRIGLYGNSAGEIRFDDVELRPVTHLYLVDAAHIRYHTLTRRGDFVVPTEARDSDTEGQQIAFQVDRARRDQFLVLGGRHDENVVFKARFDVDSPDFGVGLILGYHSERASHYRFVVEGAPGVDTFRLLHVRKGRARELQKLVATRGPDADSGAIELMADSSDPGVLRVYLDGELALVEHMKEPLRGGAGPLVCAGTAATVHGLDYDFERRGFFLEQQQKNKVFEQDSFMRHWAAPEGQWLSGDARSKWYHEPMDASFAVHFPRVAGTEVHVGVRDGWLDGPVAVRVADGSLVLRFTPGAGEEPTVFRHAFPRTESDDAAARDDLEIAAEAGWVWLRSGQDMLTKCRLPRPLAGHRIRVVGFSDSDLAACRVASLTQAGAASAGSAIEVLKRLDLSDLDSIRFNTIKHDGAFYRQRSMWRLAAQADLEGLHPPSSAEPQQLVVGRAGHAVVRFSADFDVRGRAFGVGVLFGYQDDNAPHYRFVCRRTAEAEHFSLSAAAQDAECVAQQWVDRRGDVAEKREKLTLTVDGSVPGLLRFYRNGELVFLEPVARPVKGGAGLFITPRTATVVRNLVYLYAPDRVPESEASAVTAAAPAQPEAVLWTDGPGQFLWHKGDFFSDFSIALPCVPGAGVHLGVPDRGLDGTVTLSVLEDRLRLRIGSPFSGSDHVSECPLPAPPEGEATGPASFVAHCEGHWVWVLLDGKVVLKEQLPDGGLTGARVRASGYTIEHMANSEVVRHHVIDDFFSEAPHRWLVNGGNWQIINRFQCTPSWSHMIGESPDGIAALWHKSIFQGDLTLEFYAGTRHGYYARPGDLNCTIMASTTAPDSGYTVTCTEWDYDHSQKWSTLYRLGEPLDRSDKYLVPRVRKGSVRKFLNPLVSAGRPIHGAWYYIKLRRIGSKLEYYFDNELVFSHDDDEPLTEGLVGIWTFMHSMTLAQIKITHSAVRPRTFEVTPLPLRAPGERETPEAEPAAPSAPMLVDHGVPVDSLRGQCWEMVHDAGHSRLDEFRGNASGLRLTNEMGSGRMFMRANLPPVPVDEIAGWRFLLKRTHRARLNFHYSFGTLDSAGTYTPSHHYFHRLNGTEFSEGTYVLTGNSDVSGCDRDRLAPMGGDWHRVTVWIPSSTRPEYAKGSTLMVHLEGIGNLQPSNIMCGIGGAYPGDGFAVRQLTPVFYGPPQIRWTGENTRDWSFGLSKRYDRPALAESSNPEQATRDLANRSRAGLNVYWLEVRDADNKGFSHELAWVVLSEHVEYEFGWHPTAPETVQLKSTCQFPDPRFASASIALEGTALALAAGNDEIREAMVPRTPKDAAGKESDTVTLSVNTGSETVTKCLAWDESDSLAPPVLLSLSTVTPFCETFEQSTGRLKSSSTVRQAVWNHDPLQGRYLLVQNRELGQRLASVYSMDFSVAQFPLLSFRYRAYHMTYLTAAFDNGHYVRLGDDYSAAVPVRLGQDLRLDETWHTWLGLAGDAFTRNELDVKRFLPTAMTLGSSGSPDQTGRYSKWHVDDIVFGPAVASAEQLKLAPVYFDADGVGSVSLAVAAGSACFYELDASAVRQLQWREFEPGAEMVPTIDGLEDGVHHLFLRAADTTGLVSPVTDVPFLLDTKPLSSSFSFGASANPASNGVQLTVQLANDGGAPWDIAKAKFALCGKQQSLSPWTSQFIHSPASDTLHLNYPFLLRSYLDPAKDGDTLELAIDDIMDGAGNRCDRVTVPVKVDYASDKQVGPAWYYLTFAKNVLWNWNWDGCRNQSVVFSSGSYNQTRIVHSAAQTPFLQSLTYYANGDLYRNVSWRPVDHPWLSCRICLPGYRAATTLRFALTTKAGQTYNLSLKAPGKASTELNRTQTIAWKASSWQRLSFNVRDMLKAAGVSDDALAKMTISTVNLQRRGAKHAEILYLDDFFIHAAADDPNAADTVVWYAYDKSGVASLELTCYGEDDKVLWQDSQTARTLNLQPFRQRASGKSWLMCRAKDKAGNLSVPFWIPFPKG